MIIYRKKYENVNMSVKTVKKRWVIDIYFKYKYQWIDNHFNDII